MTGKVSSKIGVIPGFLISHIIISLVFIIGFYFGLSLPFSSLYKPLDASQFILFSTLFISIPYIIFGFLYASIAKTHPMNKWKRFLSLMVFPLIFLAIWYYCRYLYLKGADGTVWLLYIITNIPSGLIIGTMSHSTDIRSPLLSIPAITTSASFLIGMLIKQYKNL